MWTCGRVSLHCRKPWRPKTCHVSGNASIAAGSKIANALHSQYYQVFNLHEHYGMPSALCHLCRACRTTPNLEVTDFRQASILRTTRVSSSAWWFRYAAVLIVCPLLLIPGSLGANGPNLNITLCHFPHLHGVVDLDFTGEINGGTEDGGAKIELPRSGLLHRFTHVRGLPQTRKMCKIAFV